MLYDLFFHQPFNGAGVCSGSDKAHGRFNISSDTVYFFRRRGIKHLKMIIFQVFYHLLNPFFGQGGKGFVYKSQTGAAGLPWVTLQQACGQNNEIRRLFFSVACRTTSINSRISRSISSSSRLEFIYASGVSM